LQIKLLNEHVGAEISGVNLAADLPDDIFEGSTTPTIAIQCWSFAIRS
jgi:hypothetical protein